MHFFPSSPHSGGSAYVNMMPAFLSYRTDELLLHESSQEQFMLSCEKWRGECCRRLMVHKQYKWLCKHRTTVPCTLPFSPFFPPPFNLYAFIHSFRRGDIWRNSKFNLKRHARCICTWMEQKKKRRCSLGEVDYTRPNRDKHMLTTIIIPPSDHIRIIGWWNEIWYVCAENGLLQKAPRISGTVLLAESDSLYPLFHFKQVQIWMAHTSLQSGSRFTTMLVYFTGQSVHGAHKSLHSFVINLETQESSLIFLREGIICQRVCRLSEH